MIASIWHGASAATKSDECREYLNQTGATDYRTAQGDFGVYVLRSIVEDERAHFLKLSFWKSMRVMRGPAGSDPENARHYPEDEEFLLGFESTFEQHGVLTEPRDRA